MPDSRATSAVGYGALPAKAVRRSDVDFQPSGQSDLEAREVSVESEVNDSYSQSQAAGSWPQSVEPAAELVGVRRLPSAVNSVFQVSMDDLSALNARHQSSQIKRFLTTFFVVGLAMLVVFCGLVMRVSSLHNQVHQLEQALKMVCDELSNKGAAIGHTIGGGIDAPFVCPS